MNVEIDQKAIEALLRGQGSATSLKTLLQNPEIGSVSTEPLLNTILDSFSFALSFLDSPNIAAHIPLKPSSNIKIGGAKGIEYYRDDSPTPVLNNGFLWRKYGQKTIKTSPYQRCYYRCTYVKDRNCNATKRVQKIKDNPSMYRSTYVGQHVCEVEVADVTYGSNMLRFDRFVSDSVMPQVESFGHLTLEDQTTNHNMPYVMSDSQHASIHNQEINMEDEFTDHVLNFINEHLMEDEQFSVSDISLISEEDMMFLHDTRALD